MNASASPAATSFLFTWEAPRRHKAAIVAFVAASVLLHAFCFYLFQIVYPPTVVLLPPPARVSLISPNSEEGRTLLRWIEAEDPALASATHRPDEARIRALPAVRHIPSYLREEPVLKEIPPLIPDTPAVSSQPPGPVPILHRPKPSRAPAPTTVLFSKELDGLGVAKFQLPKFTASSADMPQSVSFRVAVGGHGDIRYCFALNSSGDPALDEQARQHLALGRFTQRSTIGEGGKQDLVWGIATVEWGNDVSRPGATPIAAP
jgi:hypothetical protein